MPIIKPSLPKGTRDFLPEQMAKRQFVIDCIRNIFEQYGYEPLETPAIEKLEVLSGKYGDEGEKLIFKVLRRGTGLEELLQGKDKYIVEKYSDLVAEALRYDLTVPLSRVVAMYQNDLMLPFKRYQIQPVWRADRPQRGRFREFHQCDIDTVGTDSVIADAETLAVVYNVLTALGFSNFKIRLNNRKILTGLLEFAGIGFAQSMSVLITLDKLDKIGITGVKKDLIERAELNKNQVTKLFSLLEVEGENANILKDLQIRYADTDSLRDGATELLNLLEYLESYNVAKDKIVLDLTLVRGLGYYTGPIHESVVEEPKIGSLTGGGRYDRLIGMFLGKDIAATGTAFGIERIIEVMAEFDMFPVQSSKTQVLVTIFDDTTQHQSLSFAQAVRQEGVCCENFMYATKLKKQFTYADRKKIPFVAIIGPDEAARNQVTLKVMADGRQHTLDRDESINFIKQKISSGNLSK